MAMAPKRILRMKQIRTIPAVRQDGGRPITRPELDGLIELLNEREEIIRTYRDLAEDIKRELQTQFTRIVQMQQEIDELKRQNNH
jgi:hypothetical protein